MPSMTEKLPPDPGNIFASDYHRRIVAYLPGPEGDPISIEALYYRMLPDAETDLNPEQITVLLGELQGTDDVENVEGAYRQSEGGRDRLTGPALERKEVTDEDGKVEVVYVEPPPKEGRPLARAEESNEEFEENERALEATAKEDRKKELKDELAQLEEE